MKKKKILYILLALFIIGAALAGYAYNIISTGFDIDKTVYIYIDNNKSYDSLLIQLENKAKIKSASNFDKLASLMEYKDNVKSGRYAVKPDMKAIDLIRILRSGAQTPINLKFNNIRIKKDLTERISKQLMMSNDELYTALEDPAICSEMGFNPSTIVAMFIPNTYQVYWDVPVNTFLKNMKAQYSSFWTEKRKKQADDLGLTPVEVSILASIVEEECMYQDEYPMVAGLYLNRLHIGQALQADPTVKFAVGDFTLRRILNKHLQIQSPYNTYKRTGLPPGPIRIPSIKGIDSVLNPAKHNYYYMCAKADFSGRHAFARTHAEHERNAALYRAELNRRKIYQ